MKTKKRFILGIAALVFAFAACTDLTGPEERSGEPLATGMGQVHIRLDHVNARTVIPGLTGLHFTLFFTGPKGETFSEDLTSGLTLTVALASGDWKLEVKGYSSNGSLTVEGTSNVHVTEGISSHVVVNLKPVFTEGGTGTLSYIVDFPTVSKAFLSLYSLDAQETYRETAISPNVTGTLEDLPTGTYQALIDLYDGTKNEAAIWTGVVHIYNGSTTTLDQTFDTPNFAACPPEVGKGETTLEAKLNAALSSPTGSYTIVLDNKVTGLDSSQTLSVTDGKKIAITIRGGGKTVQVENTGTPLFTLKTGIRLTIQDLALQGMAGNSVPVVRVENGGTLELKAGSRLTGNTSSNNGGGVYVDSGGTLSMSGGEISGNITTSSGSGTYGGGGVFINGGTFTMSGGKISGNENKGSFGRAGGVYVNGGIFTMSGGEISGNTASGSGVNGGGVHITNTATFTMSGGTIRGNTAVGSSSDSNGGGVYVTNNGTFTLSDGEISGNTASGSSANGGGVHITNTGIFTMSGGVIYGNEAGDDKNTAGFGAAIYKRDGGLVIPDDLVTEGVRDATIDMRTPWAAQAH